MKVGQLMLSGRLEDRSSALVELGRGVCLVGGTSITALEINAKESM